MRIQNGLICLLASFGRVDGDSQLGLAGRDRAERQGKLAEGSELMPVHLETVQWIERMSESVFALDVGMEKAF